MKDSRFTPDTEGSSSLGFLRKAVLAHESRVKTIFLHPQRERLWVERDKTYSLQTRKDKTIENFELTPTAVKQLASQFDINPALLKRLRSFPQKDGKYADARLINQCLWHAGEDPSFLLRMLVRDNVCKAVYSRHYTPLRALSLVDCLEKSEKEGKLNLIKYEYDDASLRLVLGHIGLDPIRVTLATGKSMYWQPGAVLTNTDDGIHATVIAPCLISSFGAKVLLVTHRKSSITKKKHNSKNSSIFAQSIVWDLEKTRKSAPYREMGERLSNLQSLRVAAKEIETTLDGTNIRIPQVKMREEILQKIGYRDTSLFWLVNHILGASRTLSHLSRISFESSVSRLVWFRGKKP